MIRHEQVIDRIRKRQTDDSDIDYVEDLKALNDTLLKRLATAYDEECPLCEENPCNPLCDAAEDGYE